MPRWEKETSGKKKKKKLGSELTGATDFSRLSVLEENSWEKWEKREWGPFFSGIFSVGNVGRGRGKRGGERAKFSSSNSHFFFVFWSRPLGIPGKIPREIPRDGIKREL